MQLVSFSGYYLIEWDSTLWYKIFKNARGHISSIKKDTLVPASGKVRWESYCNTLGMNENNRYRY
jgi:hypothetical protein